MYRLTLALLASGTMWGHHSIPGHYFVEQTTRLEGQVVEFSYQSPHSMIQLEVQDPQSGQIAKWVVEWGPPRRLATRGVSKDSIKAGDHVIIEGNPSRTSGDRQIFLRGILRPSDGWKNGKFTQ